VPRTLGSATDQAAYRVLQEALTNAAHHGAGSAHIELGFGEAAIVLTVTNPMLANGELRFGGGNGLIGMRERATLLGGVLTPSALTARFGSERSFPTELMRLTSVLIVDDDDLMRAGADRAPHRRPRDRDRRPGIDRTGSSRASAPARAGCRSHGRSNARARRDRPTRELSRPAPGAKVLILTTFEQDDLRFRC
jgi:hypothetical protein